MNNNIRQTFIFLLLLISGIIDAQRNLPPIRKPLPLFREMPLSTFVIHFPDEISAYSQLPEQSPWYLPLNNNWKYHVVPANINIDTLTRLRYNDSHWKISKGNNLPIDLIKNINLNSRLLLRKVIPVPESWYGLQVFLHIENTYPQATIWINGMKIGFSSYAQYGLKWNITPYLVFGRLNVITLDFNANVLETKNFFATNAIIYAFPNLTISDFYFNTSVAQNNKIQVNATIRPHAYLPGIDDKYILELQLYDRRKNLVVPIQRKKFIPNKDSLVNLNFSIQKYIPWENNNPYWYTCIMTIKNRNNEAIDVVKYRIGFRQVKFNDSLITINAKNYYLDSLSRVQKNTIKLTFLNNQTYNWQIFELINDCSKLSMQEIEVAIEKQVLTYRNYTPIVAWQIPSNLPEDKQNFIQQIIRKYDTSRPIIVN